MLIRTLRPHKSAQGKHLPGTESSEYEEESAYASEKIRDGICEEVKAVQAAPENKSNKTKGSK